MATVNPLLKWRELIAPEKTKAIATVITVNAGSYGVELDGPILLEAKPQGGAVYEVGDPVLIEGGEILRKIGSLTDTSQGV